MRKTKQYPAGFKEVDVKSATAKEPCTTVASRCYSKGDAITENICDLHLYPSRRTPTGSLEPFSSMVKIGVFFWHRTGL